jgi:hypothetical protein
MYLNILSNQQNELLSFISCFRRNYYLVDGTAIALHIGHRRSIDYDLFTDKTLNKILISKKIFGLKFSKQILYEDIDQMHFLINEVKITFFNYPYPVKHNEMVKRFISMPSLLTLSAMKAFALSRRAKWKDYVDLYFIIKDRYSIIDISTEAKLYLVIYFLKNYSGNRWLFIKILTIQNQLNICLGLKFVRMS